jgi:NADH dehydrogenase/NADH:ubiquinone oxidoreductase subunit G
METVATVCGYCGVGCGMDLHVANGVVTKATGRPDHPANRGRLCTKGTTTTDMLRAGGRLATALVRPERRAEAAPIGVDAAVQMVADRLSAIRDEHGADAIALYVSGQMSIEAQYLANKLAKGYLRTQWIESNSRLCMASAGTGYKQSLGADGPPGSYDNLDTADLFLVLGANKADCHPILYLRRMDRVRDARDRYHEQANQLHGGYTDVPAARVDPQGPAFEALREERVDVGHRRRAVATAESAQRRAGEVDPQRPTGFGQHHDCRDDRQHEHAGGEDSPVAAAEPRGRHGVGQPQCRADQRRGGRDQKFVPRREPVYRLRHEQHHH